MRDSYTQHEKKAVTRILPDEEKSQQAVGNRHEDTNPKQPTNDDSIGTVRKRNILHTNTDSETGCDSKNRDVIFISSSLVPNKRRLLIFIVRLPCWSVLASLDLLARFVLSHTIWEGERMDLANH